MEFSLSEDQRLLQDSLKAVLADFASLDTVRKIAVGDAAASAALEAALSDFGLPALMVPVEDGGLGLGALEACLVQEQLGYHVASSRFLANAVAAKVFRNTGTEYLAPLASGEMRMGLALTELFSRRDGAGLTSAKDKLAGKSLLALSVDGASHVLAADTEGALHLVEAPGVSSEMKTIDRTRTFHEISFAGQVGELKTRPLPEQIAFARLLVAADTLGAAQAMLDKAVAYAKERQQFGRVIGSFQAVKHMCAEMAAKLEPSRALIWHAAHALDIGDPEGPMMANLAKGHLAEVGTFIARTATEVHGGMGFTDLVGLHYWYKRIGVNRQLFGSPEQARLTAAELQGLVA